MLSKVAEMIRASQRDCLHLAGGLGELQLCYPDKTSIIWHTFEDDTVRKPKGVCTECGRVFYPSDPDYEEWRSKPSINRMSRCGIEQPVTESAREVAEDRATYICGLDRRVEAPDPLPPIPAQPKPEDANRWLRWLKMVWETL